MDVSTSQSARNELPTISSTLLGRVQQMQPEAWGRLVEVFGPIVYRWCRQSGLSGHDASDVVQEVFASVSRGVRDFHRSQPDQSFRSWLATITRNRVRDYYRRAAKQPRGAGGTENLADWQNMADPIEQSATGDGLEGEMTICRVRKRISKVMSDTCVPLNSRKNCLRI